MAMETTDRSGHDMDVRRDLARADRVVVGLVHAPSPSTFFVEALPGDAPRGVTVQLGEALARGLGLPAVFDVKPNSGELTDALESGSIDVAFMPRDEERERRVAFGPAYFLIESTGIVHGDSPFRTTADLDRPGVRIAGIANTTTIRSAIRKLPNAAMMSMPSVQDAFTRFGAREVDAVVLSRDVLSGYLAGLPGTRLLDGTIHATGIAIAVRKDRPALLAHARSFMVAAKRSGLVRRAFDAAGFQSAPVAPVEEDDLDNQTATRPNHIPADEDHHA